MFARNIAKVRGSLIRDILGRAWALEAEGKQVIHLGVGQPNFAAPEAAVAASQDAVARHGMQSYIANAGLDGLRDAVATEIYGRRSPAAHRGEGRRVTPGSMLAFYACFAACLEPGDEVLLPSPGYENYTMAAHVLGATVVHYPLGRERGLVRAAREALEALATPRTKLVVVNSPSNPTGSVFSREELQRFVDFVGDRPGAALLSDEIYGGVCFSNGGGSAPSVFDCDLGAAEGRVVACAGVSKEFAMTGFRAGAEAALRSSDARAYAASMRDAYRARRDVALGVLGARGRLEYEPPARSICSWTATPTRRRRRPRCARRTRRSRPAAEASARGGAAAARNGAVDAEARATTLAVELDECKRRLAAVESEKGDLEATLADERETRALEAASLRDQVDIRERAAAAATARSEAQQALLDEARGRARGARRRRTPARGDARVAKILSDARRETEQAARLALRESKRALRREPRPCETPPGTPGRKKEDRRRRGTADLYEPEPLRGAPGDRRAAAAHPADADKAPMPAARFADDDAAPCCSRPPRARSASSTAGTRCERSPQPAAPRRSRPGPPPPPSEPETVALASGLSYQDFKVGPGPAPAKGQRVTVDYAPFSFVLGDPSVIAGLNEAVATMKGGGVRRVYVPASLGYTSLAAESQQPIPPPETAFGEYQRWKNIYANPRRPYQPDLVLDVKLFGRK
ncbi:transferase [Aureococcus anophagefferens]|nr:transferase [Aureococcus anophagefferens]